MASQHQHHQGRRAINSFQRLNQPHQAESDDNSDEMAPSMESHIEFPELVAGAAVFGGRQEVGRVAEQGISCAYCGMTNASALVYSRYGQRWFCNGRTKSGSAASHIINHLVRTKSKEVILHSSGPLGDTDLECYSCGCRNVFLLGFVPAQTLEAVVILCRQPCASQGNLKDLSWNIDEWEPLIQNRQFLPWLVHVPSDQEMAGFEDVGNGRMTAYERAWKAEREANQVSETEADRPSQPSQPHEDEPARVELKYNSAGRYSEIFLKLVELEAKEDKIIKEAQKQEDIVVRWDMGLNKKRLAFFTLPRITDEMRLNVGDELRLRLLSPIAWSGVGNVIKIPNSVSDEIGIEFKMITPSVPVQHTQGFVVEFVWKSTSYDRMNYALNAFSANNRKCVGEQIHRALLGSNDDLAIKPITSDEKRILKEANTTEDHSCPGLPKLNQYQEDAVRRGLTNHVTLIQGPPGTGKTVTSATIVYHIAQNAKSPILVCAPSNIAVDQLTEKISRTGLRVVRVCAKTRELVDSSVNHLALHNLLKVHQGEPEYSKLQQKRDDNNGELSDLDEKRFNKYKLRAIHNILKDAEVICATCVGSGDSRLAKIKFEAVLIDESTQATEPECLIPIIKGAKRIILVGDHCQLGPVVMCKKASRAGLTQSMFERFILNGMRAKRLNVQYRMHPALSEFPSNTFYEGSLQNGISAVDRPIVTKDFPWPRPDCPLFFYCSFGLEEISGSGTSYLNRAEASMIEKISTKLMKAGLEPEQLGVVTPYEGQRAYIVHYMKSSGALPRQTYERVEVASVDAFQGREKDFIIVSCVRSNDQQVIGFLSDVRRLNVAITRSKYGLILVGNPRVLSKQPIWNTLLHHMRDNQVLVDGPLNALQQNASVVLPPLTIKLQNQAVPAANQPQLDYVELIEGAQPSALPVNQFPIYSNPDQSVRDAIAAALGSHINLLANPHSFIPQFGAYGGGAALTPSQSNHLPAGRFVRQRDEAQAAAAAAVAFQHIQSQGDLLRNVMAAAEHQRQSVNLASMLGMSANLSQFSQLSASQRQFSQQQQHLHQQIQQQLSQQQQQQNLQPSQPNFGSFFYAQQPHYNGFNGGNGHQPPQPPPPMN